NISLLLADVYVVERKAIQHPPLQVVVVSSESNPEYHPSARRGGYGIKTVTRILPGSAGSRPGKVILPAGVAVYVDTVIPLQTAPSRIADGLPRSATIDAVLKHGAVKAILRIGPVVQRHHRPLQAGKVQTRSDHFRLLIIVIRAIVDLRIRIQSRPPGLSARRGRVNCLPSGRAEYPARSYKGRLEPRSVALLKVFEVSGGGCRYRIVENVYALDGVHHTAHVRHRREPHVVFVKGSKLMKGVPIR